MKGSIPVIIFISVEVIAILSCIYIGYINNAALWFYWVSVWVSVAGIMFIFFCLAGIIQSIEDIGK